MDLYIPYLNININKMENTITYIYKVNQIFSKDFKYFLNYTVCNMVQYNIIILYCLSCLVLFEIFLLSLIFIFSSPFSSEFDNLHFD